MLCYGIVQVGTIFVIFLKPIKYSSKETVAFCVKTFEVSKAVVLEKQ